MIKKEIFELVIVELSSGICVFNFRFVDEIKNRNTKKTFKKSRLMMQAYNDFIKNLILTQFSTIQQMSQRLIVCFAVILKKNFTKFYFRNVIQTYVQSTTNLNREFYINFFFELIKMFDAKSNCILKITKSLYKMFETSN